MLSNTENPVSFIAKSCTHAEKYDVARGLLLLFPNLECEYDFLSTVAGMRNHLGEIKNLALEANHNLSLSKGMLNKDNKTALAAMLIMVSKSNYDPETASMMAWRYFAALAVEIAIYNPEMIRHRTVATLGLLVRKEVAEGEGNSDLLYEGSLEYFIFWVGNHTIMTNKYTQTFWSQWRSSIKYLAWGILDRKRKELV